MRLSLKDSLPFVHVTISYQGAEIEIPDVLIDCPWCAPHQCAEVWQAPPFFAGPGTNLNLSDSTLSNSQTVKQ